MKKYISFFAFILLAALSISSFSQVRPRPQKYIVPTDCDLLITGGTVVTMDKDRRLIQDGAVAIKDGKIIVVGTRQFVARSVKPKRTINAAGKAIIPGLINTHTHVPMVLFRGIADDLDLQEWLTKYIFPAEAKNVNEAFVRAGTRLG
ncbi:MAG: amidohydrolase family protein, partial [Candidatus Binatia bacterium]